jgi:hypothetical protein
VAIIPALVAAQSSAEAGHRRGICSEIVKIDLMLYSNPAGHAATARCSYTDDRILITAKNELAEERMKRFVFLGFLAVGSLRNEDFRLPPKVYVGDGKQCQVMNTNDAASMQSDVKSPGNSGMARGMMSASQAPRVPCPK